MSCSCHEAQEALFACTPRGLHVLDASVVEHLGGCPDCGALARDLRQLALLEGRPTHVAPPALVEATLCAAVVELKAERVRRRRAGTLAALKAALAFLLCLPLLVFFHGGLRRLGASVLPETALDVVGVLHGLLFLSGLSVVAFLLTLFVGAAMRPPRPIALQEV